MTIVEFLLYGTEPFVYECIVVAKSGVRACVKE
jgi:hypothetical protein